MSGGIDVFDADGTKINHFDGGFSLNDGLAAGDLNNDGTDEIITAGDVGGVIEVFDRFGNQLSSFGGLGSFDRAFSTGGKLAAADIDGDGKEEILAAIILHGQVFAYDMAGNRLAAFDVGYTSSDGFAAESAPFSPPDTTAPTISNKSANPTAFSPNGDGIKDRTMISFDITEDASFPVSWSITIVTKTGGTCSASSVKTFNGSTNANGMVSVEWDGTNDTGPATVVADGTYCTQISAGDSANNPSQTSIVEIGVDTTPPGNYQLLINNPKFISGGNTYVKSGTQLQVTAHDNSGSSGIDSCTLQIDGGAASPYTLDGGFFLPARDGPHTLTVTCTDAAGNSSMFSQTGIVDDTAPALSKTIGNPKFVSGPNTYVKSTTPLNVSVTETGSGLSGCSFSGALSGSYTPRTNFFLSTPDGSKTFTLTCSDNLGNSSPLTETDIVDNTAPGSYAKTVGTPKFVSGPNTYVKSTTPLSVTGNDASGSGVASCTKSGNVQSAGAYTLGANLFLAMPDGAKNWTVGCQDQLGNSSSFNSATEIVDDTGPMVTVIAPNGAEVIFVPNTIAITWSCTDAGSGVAANSVKLEYSTNGGTNGTLIASNQSNTGSYSWSVPGTLDNSQMRIRVSCTDNVTNVGSDVSNNNFTATIVPSITEEDVNLTTGSTTSYQAGDQIQYTVTLTNRSATIALNDRPGPEFTDRINDLILIPNTGATASSGTISYDSTTRTYSWNGTIPPSGVVTLQFSVRIPPGLTGTGTQRFCNQGTFMTDFNLDGTLETTLLTSDPSPLSGAGTQTCSDVTLRSGGILSFHMTGLEVLWLPTQRAVRFAALGEGIQKINVQIFSLTGQRVYTSGWVQNGLEWMLQSMTDQPIANGLYLYVMNVRGEDGKIVRSAVKKIAVFR
ncbi:hypothetical protein HY009_10375 [Candidatus Acetothermia bacterium]|nr:hypothetical protein [Candidatus Acetothermia bacterium]